jgi:hypothetical protein
MASRQAGDDQAGENYAKPGRRHECTIPREQVEQARRFAERHMFDEEANRQETARTQQWLELVSGYEKGDQANDGDAALEQQPRKPIASGIEVGHTSLKILLLFANNLYEDAFPAAAVKLSVENLLPRS